MEMFSLNNKEEVIDNFQVLLFYDCLSRLEHPHLSSLRKSYPSLYRTISKFLFHHIRIVPNFCHLQNTVSL